MSTRKPAAARSSSDSPPQNPYSRCSRAQSRHSTRAGQAAAHGAGLRLADGAGLGTLARRREEQPRSRRRTPPRAVHAERTGEDEVGRDRFGRHRSPPCRPRRRSSGAGRGVPAPSPRRRTRLVNPITRLSVKGVVAIRSICTRDGSEIRQEPRLGKAGEPWTYASSKRCSRWPRKAVFTAAADRLHTVQSNVSEHVRQLEAELGVQLLVRSRRGTVPTEFGVRVIDRARAIRSEIEALHKDLVDVARARDRARDLRRRRNRESFARARARRRDATGLRPALSLRLTEGASERLAVEVAERELASAVVTEPVGDPRLRRRAPPRRRPRRVWCPRRCAIDATESGAAANARARSR